MMRVLGAFVALWLALTPALAAAGAGGTAPNKNAEKTNRPIAGPVAGRPIDQGSRLPTVAAGIGALLLAGVLLGALSGGGGGSANSTNR